MTILECDVSVPAAGPYGSRNQAMGADVAPTMPPMTPPPIPAALGSVPQDEYFCHGHSRSPTELKATAAPRAPRLLVSRTKGPGVTRPPGEGRVWVGWRQGCGHSCS